MIPSAGNGSGMGQNELQPGNAEGLTRCGEWEADGGQDFGTSSSFSTPSDFPSSLRMPCH